MTEPKRATAELFPSLEQDRRWPPFGWVQWKGTDACLDVHCSCGALLHYDGDFCYHVRCGLCGQVYEVSGFVRLFPLDFEPDGTVRLGEDDDGGENGW